jgi:hypothetical protein
MEPARRFEKTIQRDNIGHIIRVFSMEHGITIEIMSPDQDIEAVIDLVTDTDGTLHLAAYKDYEAYTRFLGPFVIAL